jgi:hypothetical protein
MRRGLDILPPPRPSPHAGRETQCLPRVRGRLGGGGVEKTDAKTLTSPRDILYKNGELVESPHSRALSPLSKGGEGRGEGGFETCRIYKLCLRDWYY